MADKNIQSLTAKTTPVDADSVPIHDSAATTEAKQVTWANIKATLLTYFNTVYGTQITDEAMGGSGTARTVANTPIAGTVTVYDSGVRLHEGAANDYTRSGKNFTFTVAPDDPFCDYRY